MIPGSNLLNMAMGPIARQSVQWRAWTSRALNAAGDWVSTFAEATTISGSMQPVSTALYMQLGLDLRKNYHHLWTTADVRATTRDREGDLIVFGGKSWQCQSDRDWRMVDHWRKMLMVEVPPLEELP